MTDKQLIDTLWNIRKECRKHDCNKCIFERPSGSTSNCQIMELIQTLSYDPPFQWNMTKVERIINEKF